MISNKVNETIGVCKLHNVLLRSAHYILFLLYTKVSLDLISITVTYLTKLKMLHFMINLNSYSTMLLSQEQEQSEAPQGRNYEELALEPPQLRHWFRKLFFFYKLFISEHLHYLFKLILSRNSSYVTKSIHNSPFLKTSYIF